MARGTGRLQRQMGILLLVLGALLSVALPARSTTSVTEEWTRRLDGPAHWHDIPASIVVDGSGNIYVAGHSTTSGIQQDLVTTSYAPNGTLRWSHSLGGQETERAVGIGLDAAGNVYVGGYSLGSVKDTTSDARGYLVGSYTSDGVFRWYRRYSPAGTPQHYASAMTVDRSGNVYITGGYPNGVGTDYATVSYTADGTERWVRRWDGPTNRDDFPHAIAVDTHGNVAVTGVSYGDGFSSYNYATLYYGPDGTERWVRFYEGPGGHYDVPAAVAFDSSGNLYVTGESVSGVFDYDLATISYTPEGVQRWLSRYDGGGGRNDYAAAMAMDGAGNLYVTGHCFLSPAANDDFLTVSYAANGGLRWVQQYNGHGSAADQGVDVKVGVSGDVYVTGFTYGSNVSKYDFTTFSYTRDGAQRWQQSAGGPALQNDEPQALAVDGSDNVYVTGQSQDASQLYDFLTIKYSPPPADTTPPTCQIGAVKPNAVPSLIYVPVTVSDAGRGVASVKLTNNSVNARIECYADAGYTQLLGSAARGETVTISPARSVVHVKALKNSASSSRVELQVSDGVLSIVCDPVIAELRIPRGSRRVTRRFAQIPAIEHYITIQNADPGLEKVTIRVNGRVAGQEDLAPGETRMLNVETLMRDKANVVQFTALGSPGAKALIVIADAPHPASTQAQAPVNQEFSR